MLPVVVFFSFLVFTASDYVAPEALINIAHIPFPEDQLAARVLKLQRDNFGLPSGLRCSSLIGPKCASQQALSDQSPSWNDWSGRSSLDVRRIEVRKHLQSEELTSLDVIIIAQLGLGPAVSEEELEDARHSLNVMDPSTLVEVADRVADVAAIEDKDRFRHKFLSAFANLVAEDDGDIDDHEEGDSDDQNEEGDDYADEFFLHPAKADQERNWEERRQEARIDRLTKKIKVAIAEMLPAKYYDSDDDGDRDDDDDDGDDDGDDDDD